jgi:hypothetical protein
MPDGKVTYIVIVLEDCVLRRANTVQELMDLSLNRWSGHVEVSNPLGIRTTFYGTPIRHRSQSSSPCELSKLRKLHLPVGIISPDFDISLILSGRFAVLLLSPTFIVTHP